MTGNIAVISIPPGGSIVLDGVDQYITSSAILTGITAGSHTININMDGFTVSDNTVNVIDGTTQIAFMQMNQSVPLIGTSTINVTSNPSGVQFISTWDLSAHTTPATLTGVPTGYKTVIVETMAPQRVAIRSFFVMPDQTIDINIPLTTYDPTTMGFAWFESLPYGAEIIIDGTDTHTKTGFLATLAIGVHTYEIRVPGHTFTGTFNVALSTAGIEVSSINSGLTGNLALMTIPPGAKIFIDSVDTGNATSAILNLPVGLHQIKATLSGYTDIEGPMTVQPTPLPGYTMLAGPVFFAPTTPPIGTGTVNVTTSPTGQPVGVEPDGLSGTSPVTFNIVPVGYHFIGSAPPGYAPSINAMHVAQDEIVDVNLPLTTSDPNNGYVWIESVPYGYEIWIDTADTTAKTGFLLTLSQGSHTYQIKKSNSIVASGSLFVYPGEFVSAIVSPRGVSSALSLLLLAGLGALGFIALSGKK